MRNQQMHQALCLLLSLALPHITGCGALLRQPPKTKDASESPWCSESRGGVIFDGFVAAGSGTAALVQFAEDSPEAGLLFGLLSTVFIASAVAGHSAASQCTNAKEAHNLWFQQQINLRAKEQEAVGSELGSEGVLAEPSRLEDAATATAATQAAAATPQTAPTEATQPPAQPSTQTVPEPAPRTPAREAPARPSSQSTRNAPAWPRPILGEAPWGIFWREVKP